MKLVRRGVVSFFCYWEGGGRGDFGFCSMRGGGWGG